MYKRQRYHVPRIYAKKTGKVYYRLIYGGQELYKDYFEILPKAKAYHIESYLGPTAIKAGDWDYAMLVCIPVDKFDNPYIDATPVKFKQSFWGKTRSIYSTISNLICHIKVESIRRAGKIFLNCEAFGISSKEQVLEITPSNPENFEIFHKRVHQYADGNQMLEIYTSTITDEYGNIVADGTYVEFTIVNLAGDYLMAAGTTINGVATAKIVHPDFYDRWLISGRVTGMGRSNEIEIEFLSIVNDFEILFEKHSSVITIGPILSYMGQYVPDGLIVELKIYKDQELIYTINQPSKDGYSIIILDKVNLFNGPYIFKFNVAGKSKTVKDLYLSLIHI